MSHFCARYCIPELQRRSSKILTLQLCCKRLLMTKLIRRLLPLWSDWKIVHWEGWVASHILLDLEEGRKCLGDLFILQSCASFQEDEPLASWVTRSIVDVKLIMLVLIQKWPPSFEHGQVRVIPCKQNILIIRNFKYRLHLFSMPSCEILLYLDY